MSVYMVERVLPGATLESVEAVRQAAKAACRSSTEAGKPILHLRSIFTPGESRCRCLFEAPTAALVQEVNDAAQIPYSRIIIAVDLESTSASSVGHRRNARWDSDPTDS